MSAVQWFRKKPVVIEAAKYTVGTCREIHDWMGIGHEPEDVDCSVGIFIETLEGTMTANLGDWVIRGVRGEFYPCKPDIFEATYEPAPPTPPVDADTAPTSPPGAEPSTPTPTG